MITVSANVVGLLKQRVGRLCRAWKIVRTDGTAFRFTTAQHSISVLGESYTPVGGVFGSAERREGSLSTHDVEFQGVITSDAITDDDLKAKKFDDAAVTEYLVDWQYPWAGPIITSKWWVTNVSFDGEKWECRLEGMARSFQPKIGHRYTRPCRHRLGSTGCGVSLASYTTTGVTVLGMLDGEKRRRIRATTASISGALADGYFDFGTITGTSGANNGIQRNIKTYVSATRDIVTQLPFPFPIAIGDTFTIVAGCNGLKSTCISKFNNLVNHGGFEFLLGTDGLLRVRPA